MNGKREKTECDYGAWREHLEAVGMPDSEDGRVMR